MALGLIVLCAAWRTLTITLLSIKRNASMRDYQLYQLYANEFGLTFLPKGLDDTAWEIATELMLRALHGEGPPVTHELISRKVLETSVRVAFNNVACHRSWRRVGTNHNTDYNQRALCHK